MRYVETLENRCLMSASFHESEPNNRISKADTLARRIDKEIHVHGKISTAGEHDWFKIKLRAGDVLGVAVNGGQLGTGGLETYARLLDAKGNLVIENSGPLWQVGNFLPDGTRLPIGDRTRESVEFYRVIAKTGTYYLDISSYFGGSTGKYRADILVTRPTLESAPRGTKQILFFDFDGGKVDFSTYNEPTMEHFGQVEIAPFADELPALGFDRADANTLIGRIVKNVKQKLQYDVAKYGRNDRFGITILNSRDHSDPGRGKYITRVTIGKVGNEEILAVTPVGLAQWVDVGNLVTNDSALVVAEALTPAVQAYPPKPGDLMNMVTLGFADIIAHEAGHLFGNFHTAIPDDLVGNVPNIMDWPGATLGPDFIFNTADDVDLRFGTDGYKENDVFTGVNDTLNTIAFGLTTGTRNHHHFSDWHDRDRRKKL